MPEEPPTSERAAVYYIAAIIKNYERNLSFEKILRQVYSVAPTHGIPPSEGSGSMVWFETDI